MSRVVVVGSVNLDLTVGVSHLPAPGETVLGSSAAFEPGGKGGNQAVAAARLGADTVLFAAIGGDTFGADLRTALAAERVGLDGLTSVDGATTGIAMIVVERDGENTVVVASGANRLLDAALLTGLPASLTPEAVLLLQLEVPLATCVAAARQARERGARVLLNAAPMPESADRDLAELLSMVDILVVNEGEALGLAGRSSVPPDPGAWAELADSLRGRGPSGCVITLGARGAVCADPEGRYVQRPFEVDAVDTTGAGDAFCGAFAVGLAGGAAPREATRRGCAAGALAATRPGAQSAMPTAFELDAFLSGAAVRH